MNRKARGMWAAGLLLGMGFATTATADPWDRERESGRARVAELQSRINRQEGPLGRNMVEQSVTGRTMGRDTIERDMHKRDFRDANDMTHSMSEHTKQRASRTAGAMSDEGGTGLSFPNAGRSVSAPAETMARTAEGKQGTRTVVEPTLAPTARETEVLGKSATGRTMGADTITLGASKREFKDRNDMMAHLNMQTKMRAERTAGARGDDTDGSQAFPNVGRSISDPSTMSPELRSAACRAGACIGKRASSADVDDKAK